MVSALRAIQEQNNTTLITNLNNMTGALENMKKALSRKHGKDMLSILICNRSKWTIFMNISFTSIFKIEPLGE